GGEHPVPVVGAATARSLGAERRIGLRRDRRRWLGRGRGGRRAGRRRRGGGRRGRGRGGEDFGRGGVVPAGGLAAGDKDGPVGQQRGGVHATDDIDRRRRAPRSAGRVEQFGGGSESGGGGQLPGGRQHPA